MNFEQMQLIWDEQNRRTMFAFDQASLEKMVAKQAKLIRFNLRSFELVTILSFFGVAVVVAAEPFFEGHDHFQYYEALGFLLVAAAMLVRARGRFVKEKTFDASLPGEVDLAIWRVESLIVRLREYTWLAVAPLLLMWLIRTVFELASKPLWLQILWPAWLLLTPFFFNLAIRNKYRPSLESLKSLRDTLQAGEKDH